MQIQAELPRLGSMAIRCPEQVLSACILLTRTPEPCGYEQFPHPYREPTIIMSLGPTYTVEYVRDIPQTEESRRKCPRGLILENFYRRVVADEIASTAHSPNN